MATRPRASQRRRAAHCYSAGAAPLPWPACGSRIRLPSLCDNRIKALCLSLKSSSGASGPAPAQVTDEALLSSQVGGWAERCTGGRCGEGLPLSWSPEVTLCRHYLCKRANGTRCVVVGALGVGTASLWRQLFSSKLRPRSGPGWQSHKLCCRCEGILTRTSGSCRCQLLLLLCSVSSPRRRWPAHLFQALCGLWCAGHSSSHGRTWRPQGLLSVACRGRWVYSHLLEGEFKIRLVLFLRVIFRCECLPFG